MLRIMLSLPFIALLCSQAAFAGETVTVLAKDYRFQPEEISVRVGDTVRWENQEKRQYHSVFFETLGDKQGDYFFPGEVREKTFLEPGDYHYICEPHYESHKMQGIVHVAE